MDSLVSADGLEVPRPALSVSMGNPHTVVALAEMANWRHPAVHGAGVDPIPQHGTNVEFVVPGGTPGRRRSRHITMRVHERGVGETQSCGTGACAAAVAIRYWAGKGAPDDWQVDVPGGVVGVRFFPARRARTRRTQRPGRAGGPRIVAERGAFSLLRRRIARGTTSTCSPGSPGSPASARAESQRCSESEPRFLDHEPGRSARASRGIHRRSRACSSFLPIRIGGLDQMVSKRSVGSTSCGRQA